jgi:hypothetical protein
VPSAECYEDCEVGWTEHITVSLVKFINEDTQQAWQNAGLTLKQSATETVLSSSCRGAGTLLIKNFYLEL